MVFINELNKEADDQIWVKCSSCNTIIYEEQFYDNYCVCSVCNYNTRMNARERIKITVDENSFQELEPNVEFKNFLDFPDYQTKIKNSQDNSGLRDSVLSGVGEINDQKVVVCVMDSHFMMGSFGNVAGETLTQAIEHAIDNKLNLIIFTTSGGARMQEGIFSLMQMAKISAALKQLHKHGLLYVTVITDPTTGGALASFAMLGDIIIAEPNAIIGFAGKRVIENMMNIEVPSNFQRSEFVLKSGFIDRIVARSEMKTTLSKILQIHELSKNRGAL